MAYVNCFLLLIPLFSYLITEFRFRPVPRVESIYVPYPYIPYQYYSLYIVLRALGSVQFMAYGEVTFFSNFDC